MVELGKKHECPECGTKFYDLGKSDPLCPKCGFDPSSAEASPDAAKKGKKAASKKTAKAKKKATKKKTVKKKAAKKKEPEAPKDDEQPAESSGDDAKAAKKE